MLVSGPVGRSGRRSPLVSGAASPPTVPASAHRAAGPALSRTFMVPWVAELQAGLERAADDLAAGAPGELTTLSRGRVWLTGAEAKQLDRDLRAVLAPYHSRTSRKHPAGAVARDGYWLLLPPLA